MVASMFRSAGDVKTDQQPWGSSRWISHPPSTGAKQLTVLDASLAPGKSHSFHKHPDQEEVLFVVAGTIEQWIDREKRFLNAGDSCFIAPGVVHGTFNVGLENAWLVVIFSPCVGQGFEAVDVSSEAPWNSLRT